MQTIGRQARATGLALATLAVGACASILGGGSMQKVQVSSTPAAASVSVDGEAKGATPVTLDLKRGKDYMVRIQMAGYQPYEVKLTRALNGWVWGNIIIGGPLGVIIDASTGAMYKVKPGAVDATLSRGDMAALQSGKLLYIGVTLRAEADWEQIGTLAPASAH